MLDTKGRLFGVINIIDLAVFLVVGMILAAGAYKLASVSGAEDPVLKPVQLELVVEEVRQPTVDAVAVGDQLREDEGDQFFGTVKAVQIRPATEPVGAGGGQLVEAQIPGRYNIHLTVEAMALVTDNYIKVGGREMRIGSQPTLRTQKYQVEATVFALEVDD